MEVRKIKEIAYHRNGISGEGFDVINFTSHIEGEGKDRRMVGIVFPGQGRVAILDIDELNKENIKFAYGNSWRGDKFEPELREALEQDRIKWYKDNNMEVPLKKEDEDED